MGNQNFLTGSLRISVGGFGPRAGRGVREWIWEPKWTNFLYLPHLGLNHTKLMLI